MQVHYIRKIDGVVLSLSSKFQNCLDFGFGSGLSHWHLPIHQKFWIRWFDLVIAIPPMYAWWVVKNVNNKSSGFINSSLPLLAWFYRCSSLSGTGGLFDFGAIFSSEETEEDGARVTKGGVNVLRSKFTETMKFPLSMLRGERGT